MNIEVVKLGLTDYDEALDLQRRLVKLNQAKFVNDILLLLEHPPLITLGRRANEKNILATKPQLDMAGIKTFDTDRGGDVTYHGPGQIIGYTIFDLNNYGKDIRQFVRKLEHIFVRLLKSEFNIAASIDPKHTGVWVNGEKILAIGLSVKRYVTMHGFAFNVNTNLDHFGLIVPCGIKDKGVTSLSRLLGCELDLKAITESIESVFCETFEVDCTFRDKDWLIDLISQRIA